MAILHIHTRKSDFLLQVIGRVVGGMSVCMFDVMTDLLFFLVVVGVDSIRSHEFSRLCLFLLSLLNDLRGRYVEFTDVFYNPQTTETGPVLYLHPSLLSLLLPQADPCRPHTPGNVFPSVQLGFLKSTIDASQLPSKAHLEPTFDPLTLTIVPNTSEIRGSAVSECGELIATLAW